MTSETRTPKPEAAPGFSVYSCELCINGSYWNEAQNQVMRCGYCGGTGWITRRDTPKTPTVTEVAASVAALAETVEKQSGLIQQLMRKFNTWVPPAISSVEDHEQRLAALESPAAAPELVCQCGHAAWVHHNHVGGCKFVKSDTWPTGGSMSGCGCLKYVPVEPPAAVPDAAPTLIQLVIDYGDSRACFAASHAEGNEAMMRFWSDEIDKRLEAIRAYGRDGAR